MSASRPSEYARAAEALLRDEPSVRDAVTAATGAFDAGRARAWEEIDAQAWRRWAEGVKSHLLTHLDRYLEEAEARLVENGAVVHWASDAEAARTVLAQIVDARGLARCVKAKSMLTEELDLNPFLESRGVQVRETDLGEYIVQLLGEAPSHIVGPAIHRSLGDCRALFHRELGTPLDAAPEALAAAARQSLRRDFLAADLGITGGNFLVAETGTLALIENEGNIRLTTSLPRIHVAFVGIEKLLPRLDDLAGFLQLTARAATGQPVGTYASLLQGPRRPGEPHGPDELHVVLVDNGRTRLLADDRAWEALRCVRCGACLNTCPVYRQTGGHPYGFAYSGPIGAILAPGLLGLEQSMPLPFASTLCGACGEVCPVRIPIPELLLYWRERAVDEGLVPRSQALAMAAWARAAEHPSVFRAGAGLAGRLASSGLLRRALPVLRDWSDGRSMPPGGDG